MELYDMLTFTPLLSKSRNIFASACHIIVLSTFKTGVSSRDVISAFP